MKTDSAIPTLARALAGDHVPIEHPRTRRVHRIGDEEEEHVVERDEKGIVKPVEQPFIVTAARGEQLTTRTPEPRELRSKKAKEGEMPKGHYVRKKRSNGAGEALTPTPATAPARRGKKRAAAPANSAACFIVDDLGRVSIECGGARVNLDLPETKRLAAFIDRTKAFRA